MKPLVIKPQAIVATVGTLLSGLIGAALTGATTAVSQNLQVTGGTQDWQAILGSAAAGAAVGAAAYLVKSPFQS